MNNYYKIFITLLISLTALSYECPKGFLCAMGCGLHEGEADSQARAELSKVFNVKVVSKFTTIRSTYGNVDEQFVSEVISEHVANKLEGVVIEKRVNDNDEFCAHAVLNIALFSEKIKDQISDLVNESKKLSKEGKNLVWEKIKNNNTRVKNLSALLAAIDIDNVSKVIQKVRLPKISISLRYNVNAEAEVFKKELISRLNSYQVFEAKGSYDGAIKIKLLRRPLRVAGFEKHELEYDIEIFKKSKKVGSSFGKIYQTGRTKEIVKERIFNKFEKEIENIFIELNI